MRDVMKRKWWTHVPLVTAKVASAVFLRVTVFAPENVLLSTDDVIPLVINMRLCLKAFLVKALTVSVVFQIHQNVIVNTTANSTRMVRAFQGSVSGSLASMESGR